MVRKLSVMSMMSSEIKVTRRLRVRPFVHLRNLYGYISVQQHLLDLAPNPYPANKRPAKKYQACMREPLKGYQCQARTRSPRIWDCGDGWVVTSSATVIFFPEGILWRATHSLSLTGVLGPLGMCQALLDTPPTGILQERGITASG